MDQSSVLVPDGIDLSDDATWQLQNLLQLCKAREADLDGPVRHYNRTDTCSLRTAVGVSAVSIYL